MKLSKTTALAVVAFGLILLVAGPLLPGGEHLSRLNLPSQSHVTALAADTTGSILVGNQDGELWQLNEGQWGRIGIDLDGQPVTALPMAMASEPQRASIGTGGGLVNAPPGMPPLLMRISDILPIGNSLLVGTGDGLWMQQAGAWQQALPGTNVYRIERQSIDDANFIHVGTIGEGVYSARLDASELGAETKFRPNRIGLPDNALVFCFALTSAGRLLAGTDQGLYWQAAPFAAWKQLQTGLETSRILALLQQATTSELDVNQNLSELWIGSDKRLYRVALSEESDGVHAQTYASPIDTTPEQLHYGISWILPYGDGILMSAGSVYRYGPTGFPGWYWISLAGVLLILLGGWLFPNQPSDAPGDAEK